MKVKIDYGTDGLEIEIPTTLKTDIVRPEAVPPLSDPFNAILESLDNPDVSEPFKDLLATSKPESIVIVISDSTRPVPSRPIVEALLRQLNEAGIKDQNIKLLIATGLHRRTNFSELKRMLGKEILHRVDVLNHDATNLENLEYLGETSYGSPIYINKDYLNADFKIITGYVEPHFFAGFSGGRKAISPGIVGEETILGNHSAKNIAHPEARFGVVKGNPIYEDALETAKHKKIRPDFMINVCINAQHKITRVVSGGLGAHGLLVDYQKQIAMQPISHPYDIVICNNGGAPLDLNLYQAVKSMVIGELAVKQGGTIISVNELRDGVGQPHFEEFINRSEEPSVLYTQITDGKISMADQWQVQCLTRVLMKAEVYVVSTMEENDLGKIGLKYASTVEDALSKAMEKHGKDASLLVLPNGPQIIPYLE